MDHNFVDLLLDSLVVVEYLEDRIDFDLDLDHNLLLVDFDNLVQDFDHHMKQDSLVEQVVVDNLEVHLDIAEGLDLVLNYLGLDSLLDLEQALEDHDIQVDPLVVLEENLTLVMAVVH